MLLAEVVAGEEGVEAEVEEEGEGVALVGYSQAEGQTGGVATRNQVKN